MPEHDHMTTFLLARIAEEETARGPIESCAKRRIVLLCSQYKAASSDVIPGFNDGAAFVGEFTLRALATIYADHPDYRDEWAA